jgi:rubrerythrin
VYRCRVCGVEDLVNEVIIDVVVGGAKFRGDYQGGMPKLECPTCGRETMEYVDQEA